MKIRNGFVSNSSSSSFVVFGTKVSNPLDLAKKLGFTGDDIDDAYDFLYNLRTQDDMGFISDEGDGFFGKILVYSSSDGDGFDTTATTMSELETVTNVLCNTYGIDKNEVKLYTGEVYN